MTFKFIKEIYWIHRMQINKKEKEDKSLKINQMVAITTRCIKTKYVVPYKNKSKTG